MTTKHEYMMAFVSLLHAGSFLSAGLDRVMVEQLGVSLLEQDLLSQLGKAGGKLKMVELADRVMVTKAGMTKMVDRLEGKGLVKRTTSSEDRRATYVMLTKAGTQLLKRSRQVLERWVKDHFAAQLSDEQIRRLGDVLKTLLERLDRWEGQLAHLRGYR